MQTPTAATSLIIVHRSTGHPPVRWWRYRAARPPFRLRTHTSQTTWRSKKHPCDSMRS
ncbi:hypothetical protein BC834DRAFT_902691 [Gloeopeniophorella convolvens]|nr:hypothetical protein BC834DRAFT_902691 [Gloeopeniophorella convolvens]